MTAGEKIFFSVVLFLQVYILLNVSFHVGLGIPYLFDVPAQYVTFVYFILPEIVLTVVGFTLALNFMVERRRTAALPVALFTTSLLLFPTALFFPVQFTQYVGVIVHAIF